MGELRLYAVGIEEVRGMFGASPPVAEHLREVARSAFAPPAVEARGGAGGFKVAPSGRAGVRALKGPYERSRRREAPIVRHRPDL